MEIDYRNLLNEKQFQACCSNAKHLRIIAGAGTGKTRVLTHRIAYFISELKVMPSRIVAITFTNKVAKEMTERVSKIMNDNGYGLASRPLISTFHGFCYRFLRRECSHLEGFNTKFTLADEDAQKDYFKNVFNKMNITDQDLLLRLVLHCLTIII